MRMKNPPHPGDFIRTEIIEATGLTVTAAAIALCVSRPTLSSLLNRKADLSGIMALRIEKAFGVKMDTLMRTYGRSPTRCCRHSPTAHRNLRATGTSTLGPAGLTCAVLLPF